MRCVLGERVPCGADTHEVLGMVSTEYRLVQNGEAVDFDDALARSAGAKYDTAGSVRRG